MKYLDYSGLQYYDEKLKGYVQSSLDKYVPYIENTYGGAKIVNANSFVLDSTTYSRIGAGLEVPFNKYDSGDTKYFRTGVFMKRETGSQLSYTYLSGLQYYFEDGQLNATKYQVTNESTGQGSATPSFTITSNGITLNDVKSDTNLLNSNGGVVSIDDIKSQVQYQLPVATETALGGIKSGIYIEVNTNGQILQPGSYFGSFPGDNCVNLNGKFSDWGYYNVSESATNGPEGEDLSAAGLHCRLISKRSGDVKYIEQILYLYNKDYFYTRYGRLDVDGNWTSGGNWVKHADTSSAGSVAGYGVLGSVKGRDVYANNDYTAMLGGITFDNGVIVANKNFIGRPLATAYIVENGFEDGPVDKVAGTIVITPDSDYAEVLTENESGTEGNRNSVNISQLSPILLHNLSSAEVVSEEATPIVDFINPKGHKIYVVNKGTTAQRPTNLTSRHIGIQYYDTDLKRPIWWNGESWTDANGAPLDSSNISTYSLQINDNADDNNLNYNGNSVVLNTKKNNNIIKLIQQEDDTDNRENFILDGSSNIFLKNLINKLKASYPSYNEFNINLYVEYQVNGSADASIANRVFDKLWYIEVSNRLEVTIQRIQLQHLDDGQDATLSSNVIKFVYTKESDDAAYDSPTVTVTNNMIRIENSGDGTKFLNNKGVYSSIPQAELPIDLELSGDGTKALMNDGTYKEVFKPTTTGDGTKYLSDDGTYKTIDINNNLYEEIDMKVYKIDLTTATKGILTDDDAAKIKAFKNDIYGNEPALLYLKTSSNVPYVQYNAPELRKSNFVDAYTENKTTLLRVYKDEVDAIRTITINNYTADRTRRVISFDFTSDGKIDTNIYTLPDFSFQDSQSPMLVNDKLWAMNLVNRSGVIKAEDFNLVKDYYNDGIVNSAYRTSNYIIPLVDSSNTLQLGLGDNDLRLYMMTEGTEQLKNAGDLATFQSLNTINGQHIRIKATLDDDLETLTIVKL